MRNSLFKGWNWVSFFIGVIVIFLFIGYTPQGQNFYYDITNMEGWNGVCTQDIIDECCEENETEEADECPNVPLDTPESELVEACAQTCGNNGFCYPELDAYTHKFIGCVCIEPSELTCYDLAQDKCATHYCIEEGFAKKCAWLGTQGCWCPFDWK